MSVSTPNFLKYTGLTYSEIMRQINDKIASDPKLDNYRESAIAQTQNEIFASCADLVNYNIERTAEESSMLTAKRENSIIGLSRNLYYDISRSIPAETTTSITLKGNFSGIIYENTTLKLPVFSKFSNASKSYLLKKGFTYTFTSSDFKAARDLGSAFTMVISKDDDGNPMSLIQGTIKEYVIGGTSNPFVGQLYQKYYLSDKSFSNLFGSEDLESYNTTKVWVGSSKTDANMFIIDRKSLINDSTIDGVSNSTQVKCCTIRTGIGQSIELGFGATGYTGGMGAQTTYDNIYVQYLSTEGAKANKTGVIGEAISYSGQILIKGQDVTSKTTFSLASNVIGGSDTENMESIKANAPAIYYTMDRLVSDKDYVNYLKSLTSPININNALAWGERKEAEIRGQTAIQSLCNVVLFTACGSLYNVDGDETVDTFTVKTANNRMDETVLDDNYEEGGISNQCYYNIYARNSIASQLKEYQTSTYYWRIDEYTKPSILPGSIATTYGTPAEITIVYGSSRQAIDVEKSFVTAINISSVSTFDAVAAALQAQLRLITDTRSESNQTNGTEYNQNYNKPAFPNISVAYDHISGIFKITNDITDTCYLKYIDSVSKQIAADFGWYRPSGSSTNQPGYASKIWVNVNENIISDKIVSIINKVDRKSQAIIKNIYVSPIIHNFQLTGTVYINQLYDLAEATRKINNAIYQFLDKNADFNVEVNLSNLIEIVESFNDVYKTDLKLLPEVVTPTTGKETNFYPEIGNYPTIDGFNFNSTTERDNVYKGAALALGYFFDVEIYPQLGSTGSIITNWVNFITNIRSGAIDSYLAYKESSFFVKAPGTHDNTARDGLTKLLYDTIASTSGILRSNIYEDSLFFTKLLSDIHKDVCYLFELNMLDSYNNIAPEYTIEVSQYTGVRVKRYKSGGYTMGMEIPKINVTAGYEYK